jgi:hypothetical protein
VATYRVLVVDEQGLHDWQVWPAHGDPATANRDKAALLGEVPFWWMTNGFCWLCPGCGIVRAGMLGDAPVSGWDSPRWVNAGTRDRPTLLPSLGCGAWRNGICPAGHWWLRDGELVPA